VPVVADDPQSLGVGLVDDPLPDVARPGILVAGLDVPREHAGPERLETGGGLVELRFVMPAAEREPRIPLHAIGEKPRGQQATRDLAGRCSGHLTT
jgi:hypothetical protein